MAAAFVQADVYVGLFTPQSTQALRYFVIWNGSIIAVCTLLADANAIAAAHPA